MLAVLRVPSSSGGIHIILLAFIDTYCVTLDMRVGNQSYTPIISHLLRICGPRICLLLLLTDRNDLCQHVLLRVLLPSSRSSPIIRAINQWLLLTTTASTYIIITNSPRLIPSRHMLFEEALAILFVFELPDDTRVILPYYYPSMRERVGVVIC